MSEVQALPEPVVAATKPILVTLKQGRPYLWCTCGRSQTQPWCDNSHEGTGFEPLRFKAERTGDFLLCCCKHSGDAPYCDGSHNNLGDGYEEAGEDEIAATAHLPITPRDGARVGKAVLDGGCYVNTVDRSALQRHGNIAWSGMITPDDGAKCLALYYLEADALESGGAERAVMAFPGSNAALFVLAGRGELNIAGRRFGIGEEQGAYIGPHEAFTLKSAGPEPLQVTITLCPQCAGPQWLDRMPDNFDESVGERIVAVDPSRREAMADRFYQVLIDDRTGSADLTQFIGEVPRSRAAGHHHLYEETITILSGEGYMWTQGARAEVKPGDVIFLPRRQIHSLECTSDSGMRLVGVFFPAGSPAVNY